MNKQIFPIFYTQFYQYEAHKSSNSCFKIKLKSTPLFTLWNGQTRKMGLTSSPSLTTADVSLFLAAGLCIAGLLVFFPIRINGRSVSPVCSSFLAAAECCLRVHHGACAGCFAALEVLHKLTVLMFTQHSTIILPNLATNSVDKKENKSRTKCRHLYLCCHH